MSLVNAARSEVTKQFTTSMWWILAIVLVAYIAFSASSLAFVFAASSTGALPGGDAPQLPSAALPPLLYSSATAMGYVFPLLIGTLLATSEFRHKTLTPTFLATPRRAVVLAGKLAVGVVLGVLYGVLGVVAAVGPSAAFLAGFDIDTQLGSADTWAMLGRMLIAFVLWVLIGIGVGTLVRNQVAAIVGVLVFTQFVEPIARLAGTLVEGVSEATAYLPGAASDALVGASIYTGLMPGATGGLEWWAGGLVLLAYAAVFLVLGYFTTWRRDVG